MDKIMSVIGPYFGLDWIGMALSLYSVYLLGNKNKKGFIVYIIANIIWMALGIFFMSSVGLLIGNIAFLLINIRGYLQWNHQ